MTEITADKGKGAYIKLALMRFLIGQNKERDMGDTVREIKGPIEENVEGFRRYHHDMKLLRKGKSLKPMARRHSFCQRLKDMGAKRRVLKAHMKRGQ